MYPAQLSKLQPSPIFAQNSLVKLRVVVSRKWHNPQIECRLDAYEINLSMTLQDFIAAVVKELEATMPEIAPPPANTGFFGLFKKAAPVLNSAPTLTFEQNMQLAVSKIIKEIKDASVYIV
jgi:hypothetical protein